jgi:alkylmercury lyase
MTDYTLEDAKRAWASTYDGLSQDEIDRRVRGLTALVRAVLDEGAISSDRFAQLVRLPVSTARELFSGLTAMGMQSDEDGKIVGAALTVRETPHRVRLRERELYAWCALDTLFIPGLVGATAHVRSTCPVSGSEVSVTVSPGGVDAFEPAGAALSVVLPGVGSTPSLTGPASPT